MRQLATILLVMASLPGQAIPTHPSSMGALSQGKNVQDIDRQLRHYDLIELDAANVAEQVRQTGQLSISTSDGTLVLSLSSHDIRAANYFAENTGGQDSVAMLERPTSMTYKGTVRGMDGAQARFTIDGNVIEGLIITRTQTYFVEPASRYALSAGHTAYVVYKDSDVIQNSIGSCPLTLSQEVHSEVKRVGRSAPVIAQEFASTANAAVSPLREVEIATEADNEFVQALGSAQAANNEILSIMNMVDGVYQNEIGLTFKVVFQRAWAAQDPYSDTTDVSALLTEFRNQWNSNPPPGAPTHDVVHMWTGKATNAAGFAFGGRTGVVNDGVVCRDAQFGGSAAYGLSQRSTNAVAKVVIPAHEIGHNFGATHPDLESGGHPECSATIMNSDVTNSTLTFCQFSRDQITSYVNASSDGINPNNSCLAVTTAPTVQLSAAGYLVGEAAGTAQITVNRADTTAAATVNYATSDAAGLTPCTVFNGRASERCDYATSVGTLSFAVGQSTKSFIIPIVDDAHVEGNETFTVSLTGATGAVMGSPQQATVTIVDNATPTQNPIDGADFYVTQLYIDFLGRLPDQTGFTNWVTTINGCPGGGFGTANPTCDRVHAGKSFYQSYEFQTRGYFVYKFYEVAFGRRANYGEFIPDMAAVGGPKSPQEEADAKIQFMDEFVLRPEFTQKYGNVTDPTQYVDALLVTAGVPNLSIRGTLITGLQNGTKSRAQVVRDVVESPEVENRFYYRGFVSMMYFGFVRRDPDQTGFDNYVGKLNQTGDPRAMVFDFIYSTEYRGRFGPP